MESFRDHLKFLRKKSLHLRIELLRATNKSRFGHSGSSLSAVDILVALYYGKFHDRPVMQFDPQKPGWDGQDYFILSKGHACPALYAILADTGFFPREELNHLFQMNSLLQGHPVQKIPGVVLSAGSLGHGLSGALGLAMALKAERQYNRVFCLLGDGELQEGQVWEAAMAAAHYKLDNLVLIIDDNGLQIEGPTRSVMNVDPIVDKFESFGWKTVPVRDGHNFEELLSALERDGGCHSRARAGVVFTGFVISRYGFWSVFIVCDPENVILFAFSGGGGFHAPHTAERRDFYG